MSTDPDELRYPSYEVVIQRTENGEIRTYHDAFPWDDGTWFWWSEGNQGCDCNRALSFIRAGGETPALDDPRVICGETAYKVLRFEFPDGTSIPGPDNDR